MKKLWTLLAAVFCFAACEDNLADGQQGANEQEDVIVNVSATSALGYKWQVGDSVKVVYNAEFDKEFALVPGTDATLASFSYDVEEVKDVVLNDYVYVVAPGAVETVFAVDNDSNDAENKLKIEYDIPDIQDGVITAEENLSYAVVSSELLKGDAIVPVQLNSPFAVLDLTLPQGVKSVTFTANMYGQTLVGRVNVFVGTEAVVRTLSNKKVVTVMDENGLPVDAKVLVLPGNARPLAVKMEGLDGSMYETSVLADTTLVAGKVYPINLAGDNIFSINYSVDGSEAAKLDETVAVSPLGGGLKISIVSLHTGQPTVSENADWISVAEQAPVRSFHSDDIHLQIDGNASGEEREAEVTINYGEGQSKTFIVTQGTIDMSIVQDENGEVIVWEESFGLFASEDLTQQAKAEYKNVFTIEKSDDF